MYKIKLGLHIYKKKLFFNLLILFQLLIIVGAINTLSVYVSNVLYYDSLMSRLYQSQVIFSRSGPFSKMKQPEDALSGYDNLNYYFSYTGYDSASIKNQSTKAQFIDVNILKRFNYRPAKGRWFNNSDKGTYNAVVSYTDKLKVGETVSYTYYDDIIEVKIIGILPKGEKLYNLDMTGSNADFNFTDVIDFRTDIVLYMDTVAECTGKIAAMGTTYIEPKNWLDSAVFNEITYQLKRSSMITFDTMEYKANSVENRKDVISLVLPIIVFVFIICSLSFTAVCLINLQNYKREFAILRSLGASKVDLSLIMAVMVSFPSVITALIYILFGRILYLPILVNNVYRAQHVLLPLAVSFLFALFNFVIMLVKFVRKGGIVDDKVEN